MPQPQPQPLEPSAFRVDSTHLLLAVFFSAPTPNAQFSGLVSDDRLSPEVNDAHDMPMNSPYALVALRQHKQKLLKHTIVEDILAMHTRIQPLQVLWDNG